jgi:RNA polymerase sigma factor (sigma-70 family)
MTRIKGPVLRPDTITQENRFVELVENVRLGQPAALEDLYGLVKNFTFFLIRQLGADDLQDSIHDIFLAVVQAIRAGRLRNPERLTAFLTAVARFHTYTRIDVRVRSRARSVGIDGMDVADSTNLEQRVYKQQKLRMVREMLHSMAPLDREVLCRFYLEDHPKEQICEDLKLTPNQFRNIKSQAKQLLTSIGHRRVRKPALCCA